MQVYKTFFKIGKKYGLSLSIYIVVFIILLFLMSILNQNSTSSKFSAEKVDFIAIDKDNSDASLGLINYLKKKHNLKILKSYDTQTIQDNLYYEQIQYVLTIPKGFEKNLLEGNYENLLSHNMRKDSAKGYFFNQDIQSYLDILKMYLMADYDLNTAIDKTSASSSLGDNSFVTTKSFSNNSNAANLSKTQTTMFYYFQYFAYIIVSIMIIGLTPILVTFKQPDLSARLACSSMPAKTQSIAISLASASYSLGLWLLFMFIAIICFKPSNVLSTSGLLCIINSLVFSFVVTGITLVISSFRINMSGISILSNVLGLGFSFLCGIFVPLWFLSDKVITFSKLLPAYWYVVNNNMLSGFSGDSLVMKKYWNNLGVMFLYALALIAIYIMMNQERKRKAIEL